MARNRQRAKQRQAERRAERLSRTRSDAPADAPASQEALEELELYTGAPPEDTGRSDTVVEHPPPAPEFEGEDEDLEEPIDSADGGGAVATRERVRRDTHEQRHHRNRLLAFFIAVWAELQRVEWPDRQTLTMLTGVVLLFVVVMGAYLGLLDAIFSKVIDKIL
jgi:preprotein translocase SecE subunit